MVKRISYIIHYYYKTMLKLPFVFRNLMRLVPSSCCTHGIWNRPSSNCTDARTCSGFCSYCDPRSRMRSQCPNTLLYNVVTTQAANCIINETFDANTYVLDSFVFHLFCVHLCPYAQAKKTLTLNILIQKNMCLEIRDRTIRFENEIFWVHSENK